MECQGLDPRAVKMIRDNLDLIPYILVATDIALQNIVNFIALSTYLEEAAGDTPRYSYERTPEEEEYLLDVKEHQKEIIQIIKAMDIFLTYLSENPEFEDNLSELVERLVENVTF
ncbi:hypothetical protein [Metallosphaera javensis (ex Sakai et al. 2022)]|uniref:hypothetical protein n=1 Tax=Metallosphaera javensis (ex Sakai et al. 2022) TaxID=2775498 RepID=UPI00258537C3|nr:MAG: hypothetical protein MjAS7_2268 [Metallosphaera javensis (ex Sakai et al. 2022)]